MEVEEGSIFYESIDRAQPASNVYEEYDDADYVQGCRDDSIDDQDISLESNQTLTTSSPMTCIRGSIDEIKDEFDLPEDEALKLLVKFEWDKDKLKSDIVSELSYCPIGESSSFCEQEIECIICHTKERIVNDGLSLGCKHWFCQGCFLAFLYSAIEEQALLKLCPIKGCREAVTPCLIQKYLPESLLQYEMLVTNNFMSNCKDIRIFECPRNKCPIIVVKKPNKSQSISNDTLTDNIKCETCGYSFCSKCLDISHPNLSCYEFSQWRDILEGKEESCEDWIRKNTKNCPKCRTLIEKIKGTLNQIICNNCGTSFCWECLSSWNDHDYLGAAFKCLLLKEPDDHQKGFKALETSKGGYQNSLSLAEEGLLKKGMTQNQLIKDSLTCVIDTRRDVAMMYPLEHFSKWTEQEKEGLRLNRAILCSALNNLDDYIQKLLNVEWTNNQPDIHELCEQGWMWKLKDMVFGIRAASDKIFKNIGTQIMNCENRID